MFKDLCDHFERALIVVNPSRVWKTLFQNLLSRPCVIRFHLLQINYKSKICCWRNKAFAIRSLVTFWASAIILTLTWMNYFCNATGWAVSWGHKKRNTILSRDNTFYFTLIKSAYYLTLTSLDFFDIK